MSHDMDRTGTSGEQLKAWTAPSLESVEMGLTEVGSTYAPESTAQPTAPVS